MRSNVHLDAGERARRAASIAWVLSMAAAPLLFPWVPLSSSLVVTLGIAAWAIVSAFMALDSFSLTQMMQGRSERPRRKVEFAVLVIALANLAISGAALTYIAELGGPLR